MRGNNLYNVTVVPGDSPVRSFLGYKYPRTWDHTKETCLYVGNGQGGPSGERFLPGSVIQGRYTEYMMDSLFDTTYKYSKLSGACAP